MYKWMCPKCLKVQECGSDCPECGTTEKEGWAMIVDAYGGIHPLNPVINSPRK